MAKIPLTHKNGLPILQSYRTQSLIKKNMFRIIGGKGTLNKCYMDSEAWKVWQK
jgi:hypothetical protein